MKQPGHKLLKASLTIIVLVLPALFAVHLVKAVTVPWRMARHATMAGQDSGHENSGAKTPAGLVKVAVAEGARPGSLVTGVLYTRGKAMIDWNGARIPLDNGSYAYLGGEIIQMAPDAIGLLKLADGGSVYICPGSRVRLSRRADNGVSLDLMAGASRFKFRADKPLRVKVNEVLLSNSDAPLAASQGAFVSAEVHARKKAGCLVCGLKSQLKVSTGSGAGQQAETASGSIVNVTSDPQAATAAIEKSPIPADILAGLMRTTGDNSTPAYLCRCQEIQRYARDLAAARTAIAEARQARQQAAQVAAAQAAVQAPPEQAPPEQAPPASAPLPPPVTAAAEPPVVAEVKVPLPEPAPPVAPPQAPPLALAVPGAPDPFDPNVLPPPAAGEPVDTVLVVAPPVVPVAGSGGGLPASPS